MPGETFFSTRVLQKAVYFLLKRRNSKAKKTLDFLLYGRTGVAKRYFSAKREIFLSDGLEAYDSPVTAIRLMKYTVKEFPNDMDAKAVLASLYFVHNMKEKALPLLDRIDDKKAGRYARAAKLYYQAFFALDNGDMLSATNMAQEAGKLFDKEKAFIEEARAYILMGTIYRISMMQDVAQVMFETALNIYKKLGVETGVADALGNLGMLMVSQLRFNEALDYFSQSLEINKNLKRESAVVNVLNQTGLMRILNKEYDDALRVLEESLDMALRIKYPLGKAFCESLIANLKYQQRLWDDAVEFSSKAADFYKNSTEVSSYLECLYLKSLALFEKNEFDQAADVLRKVISINSERPSCFHVANAYSLLGLIDLQLKNYKSAKSLLQQSLNLEHKNDRFSCIATDYANLSLIETRLGNNDQAKDNLEAALEFARIQGDDRLYDEIKSFYH
jgi:tetratricopeptide (TPR) repeat protein